jgi:hypothetical protein
VNDEVVHAHLSVPTPEQKTSPRRRRPKRHIGGIVIGAGVVIGLGTALGGCGGGGPSATPDVPATPAHTSDVSTIVPLPNGVISAGALQPNGTMWVLSGDPAVKTLSQVDLSTKKIGQSVGVSSNAQAVSQSSTGLLALGIGTATSGAVALMNGSSASVTGTIPVGAPVRGLAFGADGVTLYVLDGTTTSASVTVINTSSEKVVSTIGVPTDAIGIMPDPTQTSVWTVEQSGNVQQTSLQSTKPIQQLAIGGPGIALTLSPSGGTLFVLKGTDNISNIDAISTVTDSIERVIGAAAGSVGLVPSISGTTLYDVVGAPTVGNIQAISLALGE